MKRSEAELASSVIAWMQSGGWTVHEEVHRNGWSGRPDIVALLGPLTQIVEVKTAMSLALLDQIMRHECILRVVAAPSRLGPAARRLLVSEGIGYYRIHDEADTRVTEEIAPVVRREFVVSSRKWRERCCKENAAGVSDAKAGTNGGFWTPFRGTVRDTRRALESAGGRMLLKDLMDALPGGRGHYSTPSSCRAALMALVGSKVIPWARIVRDGRLVHVELTTTTEARP